MMSRMVSLYICSVFSTDLLECIFPLTNRIPRNARTPNSPMVSKMDPTSRTRTTVSLRSSISNPRQRHPPILGGMDFRPTSLLQNHRHLLPSHEMAHHGVG